MSNIYVDILSGHMSDIENSGHMSDILSDIENSGHMSDIHVDISVETYVRDTTRCVVYACMPR